MSAETAFGIEGITRRVPHRFPMLMLDRVLQLDPGVRGIGLKNVTGNEHYFQGHFPDAMIMPGVFTIEAIAQLAAVVLSPAPGAPAGQGGAPPYLVAVERMKFRKAILPGDTMVVHAEVLTRFGNMVRVKGEVRVGEEKAASGEIVVGAAAT